ncbi:YdcF family protein [Pseudomonas chlororaphis]|uniref:YdcF family protein n=1 Tax=Pseudomonas chlororaphis TaxID=587753 RepID=UPI000D0F660E|nr:YdcF family protein [Pseudomonas chlororaphis]AVO59198.1 YdcF family protein [Pseudomonas chlororaphis subsp. piscium]
MTNQELQAIDNYVMPQMPAIRSDLALIFGTRHGVEEFCAAIATLWCARMFVRAIVSGGQTGGFPTVEARVVASRLMELGIPESTLLIEPAAMNTGENVRFARALTESQLAPEERRSILAVGKVCSARRYLMTLRRHWPEPTMSALWINYFCVEKSNWHQDPEFCARVLGEYRKIPGYIDSGFLRELEELGSYPTTPGSGADRMDAVGIPVTAPTEDGKIAPPKN